MFPIAAEGWKALTRSKPENQALLSWAVESSPAQQFLDALKVTKRELEDWNRYNCPSVTGYVVENVPEGHPLHVAVSVLQEFYGGVLPRPAIQLWRNFLTLARSGDERALDEADRLLDWLDSEIAKRTSKAEAISLAAGQRLDRSKKGKQSTERGEARIKLIAALTEHHKYSNGSCLNLEPVGNNELARMSGVRNSTASEFFKKEFGSHARYRAFCRDRALLGNSLKLLNQEVAPWQLFGRKPPGEGSLDDEG
jgi:hypothetical protein